MRIVFTSLLLAGLSLPSAAGDLGVSENGRYLVNARSQEPFFYLGDTAWELFHRLDREQADRYLRDRASKGFTVIQAVALAELDGLNSPNAYGHRPLIENDPTRPDLRDGRENDYWDHVDFVVGRANELGLVMGLLPTWGDKWNLKWGVGPVVFGVGSAEAYGRFLGERYRDADVIWILGGDRNPESDEHLAITRAMARGIAAGDGGEHLMTFHPQGGSSSADWFHDDDWLDFNMFQSGHGTRLNPNHEVTQRGRELEPTKPVLDGEPCYEDHPVDWKPEQGWFDEWDARRAAWNSMLSGAAGHTYGNHNIWQMWQEGRDPISSARTPWYEAIHHPGSAQMGHMRRLLESRPFHALLPDQSLVVGDNPPGADQVVTARGAKGDFILAYVPTGKAVKLRLDSLASGTARAWWYNPRQHAAQSAGEFVGATTLELVPPSSGRNNDWVLVLDDLSAGLPPPAPAR
jgi:hypothetical protein